MAANAQQQQQLLNLLKEVKSMLGTGSLATPEHKKLIAEMLLKGKVFAETAPIVTVDDEDDKGSKEKKKKAPAKEKALEAECGVCGEVRTGRYVKRGFKCDSCLGTKESITAVPVSMMPDRIPSSALPHGFHRQSTSNYDAMQLGQPAASGASMFGSPSITVEDTTDPIDEEVASPIFKLKGQLMPVAFVPPKVRYGVSQFKLTTQDTAEIGDVGLVNEEGISSHRLIYFPTMLYNYSLARDRESNSLLVCHENADLLRARGVALGPVNRRNYEIVMQAALSALQLLQHLKEHHGTAHGDLRPYNFFIDVHHIIKVRVAPFATHALLPPPFRAPEDSPNAPTEWQFDPKKKEKKAVYARDMYALGVSLCVFAYGSPELPDEADVEAGRDTLLFRFLQGLCNPNANERLTIDSAMHDQFLGTIRIVNGVPVESVYCRVDVGSSTTALSPKMPSFAGRRVSGDSTSHSPSPFSGSSANPSFRHRKSIVARLPPIADQPEILFNCNETSAGALLLEEFFRTTGPLFQVVKATRSVTVYSVAMDPRRSEATDHDASTNDLLAGDSTLSMASSSLYASP